MTQAERSVSVVLRADIQDYVSKMGQASKATKDFAAQTGKVSGSASTATKQLGTSAKSASTDLDNATKSTKTFGDAAGKASADADRAAKSTKSVGDSASTLGLGLAAAGAAIAVGVGAAVKAFADFDKEMSNVRAVSGATAGEMNQLTDAALKAGAATVFSASQAAEAEAELVKAGISVQDVLSGGLDGALSLASAGSLDLANAATISANAMNIFSLKGSDVGRIANVLAAGANRSAADVDQLGQALQQSGLVAAQMGLTLEETTGILAAFADNGLKGSDAGTSLKTMLQRLVPTSTQAAAAMKDIGFSAYDAQGNLKRFDVVAQDLRDGMSGLTQKQRDATLATIFGSDAVRGANVAFKLGAKGVNEYTASVTGTTAATDVAREKLNNLAGDVENLRGSLETALIKGGSGANDGLRDLAKGATSAVNAFSALPPIVQEGTVKMAALAAGTLIVGGVLVSTVPKVIAMKDAVVASKVAFDAFAISSPKAAGALKALAGASIVVGTAAAANEIRNMGAAASVAQPPVDQLAKGLLDVANGAEESKDFGTIFARGMGVFRNDMEGADDALANFGANANAALNTTWYETFFGSGGQAQSIFAARIKQIDAALVQLVQGGHADEAAKAAERLSGSITQFGGNADQVRSQLTGYKAALEGTAVANGQYADSTQAFTQSVKGASGPGKLLADEIDDQKKSAEAAETAYKNLTDAVKGYGNELSGALSATSKYEASVDQAAERVQKRADLQSQISKLQKADAKGNADEIARLQEQLKGYAATLDLGSEAGRANTESLLAMAQGAKDAAVANSENGVAIADVRGQFDRSRQTFIDQAIAFGATKDQARAMADQLGLTQTNLDKLATAADVKKTVTADTAQADANLHSITRQLEQIDATNATATVTVTYERVGPSAEAIAGLANGSLGFKGFAGGGYTGDGGKFEPKGVVHGGEWVFTKEETANAGVGNLAALAKRLRGYDSGGFVSPRFSDPGLVASAMSSVSNSSLTNDNRMYVDKLIGVDLSTARRDADRSRRLHALTGRRAKS